MFEFHSVVLSCPVFPAPLTEETTFYPFMPPLSKIRCP